MIDISVQKINVLPTPVEGVDFVVRYRYAAGRKIAMPYFRVKLCECLQERNGHEFAFVSIAKWGWIRAWKKALITLTVKKNREKVVRSRAVPRIPRPTHAAIPDCPKRVWRGP